MNPLTAPPSLDAVIETPLGRLGICCSDAALESVDFLPPHIDLRSPGTPLARWVAVQLDEYFRGMRREFDLPLAAKGTPFRQRVWCELRGIPAGQTRSYGEIARMLCTSARAVGGACRTNPLPIVVPCHRVVAARGLGGYDGATAGAKVHIKRWLLEHEHLIGQ